MHFTQSHEWIQTQGDLGVMGVTHHAQKELGDIVYVELPQVGKTVQKGQEVAVLESTKAAADVYSPVSGEIIEVNHALSTHPDLINQSAEKEGWIAKIRLSNPSEVKALLDLSAYQDMIE